MSLRVRASGLHFLISASIALLASLLVFLVWYPSPYATFSGGLALFAMLVGIDVVLGPVLTALVASPDKPGAELRRDIGLIALVQLLAFGYGMYTIAMARPVHLVFEVDRLQVVTAADIETSQLDKALPEYRQLPWTGPTLLAARKPVNQEEMLRGLDLGIQGLDISMQPERWVSYASFAEAVFTKARPVKLLLEKYPELAGQVQAAAAGDGVASESLRFLPMTSRHASGVALLAAPGARIVAYLPVEGFF
ncbi:TfpX/TfpZ family type IV pilin accessory protein [Polaromonas sp.]|uniref:TfpX/TfpZ family type IV pilin accessory protein n=1 Tax=Polaromonas sp. TaxID=1869339 RepID=UPI0027306951|nr:TfpX/TfpZ family type IV pilin accessory protein [Polaromonas sp.]MDP1741149.1 TfpX/TfpZ family type IV pilin accessory protein [Polaromonas sp.]